MNETVEFLRKIKLRLISKVDGLTEYKIANERFGRVQSSYQQLEKNKLIPIVDFPAIRQMALDAGISDQELNDMICQDAKRLKKQKEC